jgi:valyl-tRNA synthetase
MDIAFSRKLDVLLQNAAPRDTDYLGRNVHYLTRLGGVESCRILDPAHVAPISAVALLGTLEILVPMAGLIDPDAELARLTRRQGKAEADLRKMEIKVGNPHYAENAPPDIMAKDRQRLAELRTEIGQLAAQIARVARLKDQ